MAATESGALRKRGISLKKKILTAGFAALALFGGAAEAQAIDWHETESKSAYRGLWAFDCADADQVDVKVPAGAHNPEVVSPLPGQQLNGRDIDDMDLRGPVRVTDIANLGSSFRFTVQSVGDWCTVREDGYAWDYGWEVPAAEFRIRWQITKRIEMTRNLARNLTEEALLRRFSWFDSANHGGYRCRISGNRGRCRHVFVIGDGAVIGVVKLRLVARTGQKPLWNYRLNALQIDEYCRYVTHAGNCTTRVKKQRNRVSLPYWVRAKNALEAVSKGVGRPRGELLRELT